MRSCSSANLRFRRSSLMATENVRPSARNSQRGGDRGVGNAPMGFSADTPRLEPSPRRHVERNEGSDQQEPKNVSQIIGGGVGPQQNAGKERRRQPTEALEERA